MLQDIPKMTTAAIRTHDQLSPAVVVKNLLRGKKIVRRADVVDVLLAKVNDIYIKASLKAEPARVDFCYWPSLSNEFTRKNSFEVFFPLFFFVCLFV